MEAQASAMEAWESAMEAWGLPAVEGRWGSLARTMTPAGVWSRPTGAAGDGSGYVTTTTPIGGIRPQEQSVQLAPTQPRRGASICRSRGDGTIQRKPQPGSCAAQAGVFSGQPRCRAKTRRAGCEVNSFPAIEFRST